MGADGRSIKLPTVAIGRLLFEDRGWYSRGKEYWHLKGGRISCKFFVFKDEGYGTKTTIMF